MDHSCFRLQLLAGLMQSKPGMYLLWPSILKTAGGGDDIITLDIDFAQVRTAPTIVLALV